MKYKENHSIFITIVAKNVANICGRKNNPYCS